MTTPSTHAHYAYPALARLRLSPRTRTLVLVENLLLYRASSHLRASALPLARRSPRPPCVRRCAHAPNSDGAQAPASVLAWRLSLGVRSFAPNPG